MGDTAQPPRSDERSPSLENLHPKVSVLSAPLHIRKNLSKNRYLLDNMVSRNLNQRYDKALLGYLWTLLERLLLVKADAYLSPSRFGKYFIFVLNILATSKIE